ncbi:hypothetical protein [Rhizobium sp. S163]|uniref:hypothetical protein n=1 Tax=Rhizobium sp. S163 TaxID=3055039 RepID=UPI0025A9E22D|nr:hypothetical protein [Rhizobium sp. S163]MDM9644532.1 hypothetical protein [Rhizobium sp. S163]
MPEVEVIYVTFRKEDDRFTGHAIMLERPTPETFANWGTTEANGSEADGTDATEAAPDDRSSLFQEAISSFASMMTTYRNMIPFTIELSPLVSGAMANNEIGGFVKKLGSKVEEFESEEFSVFEVSAGHLGTLFQKHQASIAALNGAEHLPEISVIGLISVYDAYLARLLKAVFLTKEEIIFTSERDIKYSDLLKFDSLEEAKTQIIEKEVETAIRNSHHEQFSFMEKRFSIKLREGLTIWPDFIELCERRNLLTHTGGVVSQQYLKNCAEHGYKSSAKVGDKLVTDAVYLKAAVKTVSELGLKLGHVLWRKFVEAERSAADSDLNQRGMDMIIARDYVLAEQLLEFGAHGVKKHSSDATRRMMIVNLANAVRLGGDAPRAKSILNKEDWSATGINFQICVAAVREDVDLVCSLMRDGGKAGALTAESYRDWPVFRGMRQNQKFRDSYKDVFGQELLAGSTLETAAQGGTLVDGAAGSGMNIVRRPKLKIVEVDGKSAPPNH